MLSSDEAVSSVVGTVLILSITVTAFAGVSLVVLDAVEEGNQAPRSDIDIQQRGDRFMVLHRGGDPIAADDVELIVYTDGVATRYSLADHDADGVWKTGETVSIPAIHGDAHGIEVIIRSGGSHLAASAGSLAGSGGGTGGGTGGTGGGTGGGSTNAELAPTDLTSHVFDPGSTGTFRVTVSNTGGADADPFDVLFDVDNGAWTSTVNVAALTAGASTVAESDPWPATSGSHDLQITVDSGGAVTEDDEADNVLAVTFDVASASGTQAFQDADGDGVYDLGTDPPVTAASLSAAACSSSPCSAGDIGIILTDPGASLVVPADSSPLDITGNIYLEAPGDVTVETGLSAQGTGNSGDIQVSSTGALVKLSSVTYGTGDVAITAAAGIDASGAHVEADGNGGLVALTTTAGDVLLADTELVADIIEVDAPASGAVIDEQGLHLCITWNSLSGSCLSAHQAGGGGDSATNVNGTPLIGTRAEGAWT